MQPFESSGDPRIDAICGELAKVAERSILDAFGVYSKQGVERRPALSIPELRIILERSYPDEWRENRWATALELAIRRAIDRLSGHLYDITMQEAAFRLFNLDGSPSFPEIKPIDIHDARFAHIKGKHYNKVLHALVEAAGVPPTQSSGSRATWDIRLELAKVLADDTFPFTSTEVDPSADPARAMVVRSTLKDEFVARPDYEQAIRHLRDAGERHVWLWGDAGTGKSRLARAVNRDVVAEIAVPVLVAGNEQRLQEQISELIVNSGVDPRVVNSANAWALFFDQLGKGKLPHTLVFDDMPRSDLVITMTSTQGSFIIFTSIERPPPTYIGPSIEIHDLTAAESEQMIRSRLSDLEDTDVQSLIRATAGRPLAIEHSCSYLRETGQSITDYCTALAREPARILEAAGTSHGRTLTRVYELILEQLADSFDSTRALDYILFTQPELLTEDMLSHLWVDSLKIPSPEAMATFMRSMPAPIASLLDAQRWQGTTCHKVVQVAYLDPVAMVELRAALRRLVDFGLIRSSGVGIVMHQLTAMILSSLRRDEHASDVYERVKKTAYDLLLIDEWEPGEPLQGHLVPWAPHVARIIARVDAAEVVETLTRDEVKRLTLLGAMVVRAHLQAGTLIDAALNAVKNVHAVAAFRVGWEGYDPEDRAYLAESFFGLYREMATVLTLRTGFRRDLDGMLLRNQEDLGPELGRMANGIRLEYDTEWQLSHEFVAVEASVEYAQQALASKPADTNLSGLLGSARTAVQTSRIYYDQCRWHDAILVLEHAYSCYVKIGGDMVALRGAIDAARRLARVHLRGGPAASSVPTTPTGYLDEAAEWVMQARAIKWRRSDGLINGHQSRFRLRDALLDSQIDQVSAQIDLTRQLLEWDDLDGPTVISPELLAQFITQPYQRADGGFSSRSRLDEAHEALNVLRGIRGRRFEPEFRMHITRLATLAGNVWAKEHLDKLESWFADESLEYQTDLLTVQRLTFSAAGLAALLLMDEATFLDQVQLMPDEVREEVRAIRANPTAAAGRCYSTASAMREHHNPYWHARGLAAALVLGSAGGNDAAWMNAVYGELKNAAASIGRTDWIDMAYGYGESNGGLWLIAY